MGKNKILLIDMYGVIIKESKGYFIPYTYQHFNNMEFDRITSVFKEEKYFTRAQMGDISSDEFLRHLGYHDPQATMKDYLKNYLTLDEQFNTFAEEYNKRLDFCLLSNDVPEWSEFLTAYYHLNPFFKEKIVSGEVHIRKPDRRIFLYALDRLKCKPEDCIFVDNSVKNLLAAEELGIQVVLFNRDGETYNGKIVNDFTELGKMLDNGLGI